MFPRDTRRERRSDRPRRRPDRISVEGLETRQLLAYSPFGYSLPELSVTGYAAKTAAWGGLLTVDVTVQNQGASSLIEPLDLEPGTTNNTLNTPTGLSTNSTADSTPTTVEVFASPKPNATNGLVLIDTINFPGITQNSSDEILSTIGLPAKPKGFPGVGGKIFLTLVVNNDQSILQSSQAGNIYRVPNAVHISDSLPDLQVVNFDAPTTLQPGDVIAPTIRIANFGSANPNLQGPVTVELVASQNKTFGPGDSVLSSFVISSLPGVSGVPTQTSVTGDTNLTPLPNEFTTTLPAIKLPTKPGTYYIGIVIDPTHAINQTYAPNPALRNVIQVGPRDLDLPPTTVVVTTNGKVPVFPALPSSVIEPTITGTTIGLVNPSGSTYSIDTAAVPTLSAASVKSKKTNKS